jgi:PIN domain nuclease of toxin-antitoxin system
VIVLDTHALVWLLTNAELLSEPARRVIEEAESSGKGMRVAAPTLYEIAYGAMRGRIKIAAPVEEFIADIERRFLVRPLTPQIALAAAQLPAAFPSDPFDRIIAATAMVEGVPLLTADQHIRRSRAVRTVW